MSQNLDYIPPLDGTNYGYWKAHMRLFLKSLDVWQIVESGWTPEEPTAILTVVQSQACRLNDKALNVICQALSPSKFSQISHCEIVSYA
jgi:hypothetical protein